MADKIVVVHHFSHGIGERKSNGQRETLGNGNHEDCDGDDEELDELVNVWEVEHISLQPVLLDTEADNQHQKGELNAKSK